MVADRDRRGLHERPIVPTKNGDAAAQVVGNDDIGHAVAIHVSDCNATWAIAGWKRGASHHHKPSLTVVNHDGYSLSVPPIRLTCPVPNGQIRLAVSVEVSNGQGKRCLAAGKRGTGRLVSSSLAVTEKDRHIVAFQVGRHDVRISIQVQVGNPQSLIRSLSDIELRLQDQRSRRGRCQKRR